jgi:uncharacterized protein
MSAARSDLVNAVELAGRSAVLERKFERTQLPRLVEAGALDGSVVSARLEFGLFERRPTIEVTVGGRVMLPCQRCLRPCECRVDDKGQVMVVADDTEEVPGGFDPVIGDPERLSVTDLVEEQILLGMPLVPMHEDAAECGESAAREHIVAAEAPAEDKQRPFANLRELLEKDER